MLKCGLTQYVQVTIQEGHNSAFPAAEIKEESALRTPEPARSAKYKRDRSYLAWVPDHPRNTAPSFVAAATTLSIIAFKSASV